jgi:hypothetical protein
VSHWCLTIIAYLKNKPFLFKGTIYTKKIVAELQWMAHAYNFSYSGGRDQEDQGSKLALGQ